MKIGIVSDTHNNLANVGRIVALFNETGVDRVIHTGDVTQAKTIEVFSGLAMPMVGVYGNNDQERDSLDAAINDCGFQFQEPPLRLEWSGRRMIVVHDPLEFEGHLTTADELAIHGHTHLYRREHINGTMHFNPGECAGHMKGYNAIGVVDLTTLDTELLKF